MEQITLRLFELNWQIKKLKRRDLRFNENLWLEIHRIRKKYLSFKVIKKLM